MLLNDLKKINKKKISWETAFSFEFVQKFVFIKQ